MQEIEKKLKILVAPLDWGLGHATRCIPVIRQLIALGHEIVLAAEKDGAQLLQHNFPEISILPIRGYRIQYGKSGLGLMYRIISQIPGILRSIRKEKQWLEKQIAEHQFDLVISDNRYGLYSENALSIILTHQLQIISGFGRVPDRLLRFLHYKLLEKFDACWVVDLPGDDNMGGELSHPSMIPANARYIGYLSQFSPCHPANENNKEYILVLLSGPEPMRGLLEQKLLSQASLLPGYRFVFIAGKPSGVNIQNLPAHISYSPYSSASELENTLRDARLVICRSGYSTLMDLSVSGKRALLIPTPGQTEQEYLARQLMEKGVCLARSQQRFDLSLDIPAALLKPGFACPPAGTPESSLLEKEIDRAIRLLR